MRRTAAVMVRAALASACTSVSPPRPPSSGDPRVERQVQIYAAVLRKGVGYLREDQDRYGLVWVADRPRKAGATVGGKPRPDAPAFAPAVRDGLRERLPKLDLRFVHDIDDVRLKSGLYRGQGVAVQLGPIRRSEGRLLVGIDVFEGPWNAHGATYILRFRHGQWVVRGTPGIWIT
jgi:hypothetical protein